MHPTAYKSVFAEFGKRALPFVSNFRGVIFEISGTGSTENGASILSVKVQDKEGDVMKVLALGRYADDGVLREGAEVIAYFAKAQKARKAGQAPVMWLFSDAYVQSVSTDSVTLPIRREIVLQDS